MDLSDEHRDKLSRNYLETRTIQSAVNLGQWLEDTFERLDHATETFVEIAGLKPGEVRRRKAEHAAGIYAQLGISRATAFRLRSLARHWGQIQTKSPKTLAEALSMAKALRATPARGGRPARSSLKKAIAALERAIKDCEDAGLSRSAISELVDKL